MLHRFTEHELLDLVEGGLDALEAEALRSRLAGEPHAQVMVQQMQADRSRLRGLDQPELPAELLARIEPMLARPMLMAPLDEAAPLPAGMARATDFRRQRRQRTHRIVWSRVAVAASLLLALLAGVWALVAGVIGPQLNQRERLAVNDLDDRNDRPNESRALRDRPDTTRTDDSAATSDDAPRLAAGVAPDEGVTESVPADLDAAVVAADFALVVRSSDAAEIEHVLARAVEDFGDHGAVVRNFSFAHAQRLEREWRLADARGTRQTPPLMAAAPGSDVNLQWKTAEEFKMLADRVRARLEKASARSEPGSMAQTESGVFAGPQDLAPTLERQLDFSSRGAAYTIALPAAKVNHLVERLTLVEHQETALRVLPAPPTAPSAGEDSGETWQPVALWLNEGPIVRQAVERLSRAREGATVHVPVIVVD